MAAQIAPELSDDISKSSLTTREVVLPPALVMLEEVISIFVEHELGLDDAITLVRDTFIRLTIDRHPDASIRALTTPEDGKEKARIPLSRNTINAVRSRARDVYEESFTIQFERYIRMNAYLDVERLEGQAREELAARMPGAEEGDEFAVALQRRVDELKESKALSRAALKESLRHASEFRYVDPDDFALFFARAFDKVREDCLEQVGKDKWINARQVTYLTTETLDEEHGRVCDELTKELASEDKDPSKIQTLRARKRALEIDDVKLSIDLVQRTSRMMREMLEGRFLCHRLEGKARQEHVGAHACSFELMPSQISLLDSYFHNSIRPFIKGLASGPEGAKEAIEAISGIHVKPFPRFKIAWMWAPETHDTGAPK